VRAILLSVILLLSVGCSSETPPGSSDNSGLRIAFVTNNAADFWVLAQRGVEAAAEKYGVHATFHMPTGGVVDQKRILEDLLVKGVDGIAVSPIDPVNQTEFLDEVAERTKLITHDSDAPDSKRLCFVGVDNYVAGRLCGEIVQEALPSGGKIAIFIGRMEQDNARRRRQGVIDQILGRTSDPDRFDPSGPVIEGNGFTIVGTYTDQIDVAKAKANVEDVITRHPDIAGLVGLFAYNPPVILEVLAQSGKTGEIQVIGFDEADETLAGIEAGTVAGTVVQDPYQYGYRSIEILFALTAPGVPFTLGPSDFVHIPARAIRRAEVVEFRADIAKKLGKE
jgi:ribose transport system substrate-binding protein